MIAESVLFPEHKIDHESEGGQGSKAVQAGRTGPGAKKDFHELGVVTIESPQQIVHVIKVIEQKSDTERAKIYTEYDGDNKQTENQPKQKVSTACGAIPFYGGLLAGHSLLLILILSLRIGFIKVIHGQNRYELRRGQSVFYLALL